MQTVPKNHISDMVLKRVPKVVGVYRLSMKKDSDNFRQSSYRCYEPHTKQSIEVVIYDNIDSNRSMLAVIRPR